MPVIIIIHKGDVHTKVYEISMLVTVVETVLYRHIHSSIIWPVYLLFSIRFYFDCVYGNVTVRTAGVRSPLYSHRFQ